MIVYNDYLQAHVYRLLMVVVMLSLAGRGQCFILPIQKRRNPLDIVFRGLAGPMKMKTDQ